MPGRFPRSRATLDPSTAHDKRKSDSGGSGMLGQARHLPLLRSERSRIALSQPSFLIGPEGRGPVRRWQGCQCQHFGCWNQHFSEDFSTPFSPLFTPYSENNLVNFWKAKILVNFWTNQEKSRWISSFSTIKVLISALFADNLSGNPGRRSSSSFKMQEREKVESRRDSSNNFSQLLQLLEWQLWMRKCCWKFWCVAVFSICVVTSLDAEVLLKFWSVSLFSINLYFHYCASINIIDWYPWSWTATSLQKVRGHLDVVEIFLKRSRF